ncbi:MAG: glycine/betaine ABC transporter, partial [Pseudomonadota bacterium]
MNDSASENREELIPPFVATNGDYYQRQFDKIGSRARFTWTFNWVAALLGPIWYGMRGLWNWGLPFIILETFAVIQLARGLFGDLGAEARDRISQIEGTLEFRRQQLEAAIEKQSDKVDVFKRAIESLENAIADINLEIAQAEAAATSVALFGLGTLLLIKLAEGIIANPALEKRFSQWLSDRTLTHGLNPVRTAVTTAFVILIFTVSIIHFAFPGTLEWLETFPTDRQIRLSGISVVERIFDAARNGGGYLFDSISYGIRVVLDGLEVLFVQT